MHKSFSQWHSLATNSLPIRKKSTETLTLPDFWQKLKVLPFLKNVFQKSNGNVTGSTTDAQKDSYLNYEYISSGKTVASIQNRAVSLLHQIEMSETEEKLKRIGELVSHMKAYPVTRTVLKREGGIRIFLNVREHSQNSQMKMAARAALVILGYADPVKGHGIRILSLDGGGTRGVVSIEMLRQLEKLTQKRIHEMFDLIVGTSTGALLAFLIGISRMPLSEIMKLYKELSSTVFKGHAVIGAGNLFLKHALYDTEKLLSIFQEEFGTEKCMIDTAFDIRVPKIAAVSTLVNHGVLQPYVFRNYCMPPLIKHSYYGSSKHKLWETLQATTAALGYFEECKIGNDIHQDGGLLTNNPCALAIHESKRLWPNTPLQTVVSIGTGVYHGTHGPSVASFTTFRDKMLNVVASATDVEAVHNTLKDLLPASTYFRFNPNLSADIPLDESDPIVIDQLITDAQNYIDKYAWKYRSAADSLAIRKTGWQIMQENIKREAMMRF